MQAVAYPTSSASTAGTHPVYTRGAVFGLSVFSAGGLLLLVAALLSGDSGFAVFAGIITVVPAVLAFLVQRFGTWAKVVAGLLSLLALAMLGPELPFGVQHFNSFFDFAPAVIGVTGIVVALLCIVTGLVQRRRGTESRVPSPGQRRTAALIVTALVIASAASAVATVGSRSTVSASAKAGATAIKMKGTKFAPLTLQARAGQAARFDVKNSDPGSHTFTIKQLGVDVTVNPGSEKLVALDNVAPGTYTFICRWHDNMKGTLTVTQ